MGLMMIVILCDGRGGPFHGKAPAVDDMGPAIVVGDLDTFAVGGWVESGMFLFLLVSSGWWFVGGIGVHCPRDKLGSSFRTIQ